MNLKEVRENIDKIDSDMARLFEERMKCIEEVVRFKIENNLEIFDEKREKIVIDKNKRLLKNKEYEKYYIEFIKDMMKISKDYQLEIMKKENMK